MLNNTIEYDYRALQAARHEAREAQIELLKLSKILALAYQENEDVLGQHRSRIEPLLTELVHGGCHNDTFKLLDRELEQTLHLIRDYFQTEPMRPPWEE